MRGARIVLATWGSLGDLHPYIAVGRGLRGRGHDVTLCAPAMYRPKVEGEDLRFQPYAPDVATFFDDPDVARRSYDARSGTEFVVRGVVLPALAQSHAELYEAADGADLLVSHPLTYAVPIVSEERRIPFVSVVLAPMGFLSAYDPPFLPQIAWLHRLRRLGRWPFAAIFRLARMNSRRWARPIVELRGKLGLPLRNRNYIIEGTFSPRGTMAWFSRVMASPQPDWPPETRITGFPFYDRLHPGRGMSAELASFLRDGPPPVVFTLGSSAVMDAGDFYRRSLDAASRLGCRAVLLTGPEGRNRLPGDLPHGVIVAEYAPYSELFPHAATVVHQGGIGTTAQVMRAGRPMLVVPFAHDQPDNAHRIERLGCGRSLPRAHYTVEAAAGELSALLSDATYGARAAEVGRAVAAEDGVAGACDFIEARLGAARGGSLVEKL